MNLNSLKDREIFRKICFKEVALGVIISFRPRCIQLILRCEPAIRDLEILKIYIFCLHFSFRCSSSAFCRVMKSFKREKIQWVIKISEEFLAEKSENEEPDFF